VFSGGFTLQDAETLCGTDTDLDKPVLDGLASLVDGSLLNSNGEASGGPRFAMLETIREFAAEQLGDSAERRIREERHALYFLDLAEQGETALLHGPGQVEWFQRLARDHDNFRAALRWMADNGRAAVGQRAGLFLEHPGTRHRRAVTSEGRNLAWCCGFSCGAGQGTRLVGSHEYVARCHRCSGRSTQ
jgi:predicted ATPase